MNQEDETKIECASTGAQPDEQKILPNEMISYYPMNLKKYTHHDGTTVWWAEDPNRPQVAISISAVKR